MIVLGLYALGYVVAFLIGVRLLRDAIEDRRSYLYEFSRDIDLFLLAGSSALVVLIPALWPLALPAGLALHLARPRKESPR